MSDQDFNSEDVNAAVRVLNTIDEKQKSGDRRAAPLSVYRGMKAVTVEPAVEVIVIDRISGQYALTRRPPTEKHFGPNKVHILGGFLKPTPNLNSLTDEANWMAISEHGFVELDYVAGPIAVYRWGHGEHPEGHPVSLVYVMEMQNTTPKREDIVWYDFGQYPSDDKIIIGRAGEIHMQFLRVFHDQIGNDFQKPCVDLNQAPWL